MKTQNESRRSGTINNQLSAINYAWVDSKGRMHLGRSVGTGRDRAHAERRFFNQHRHVVRDESGFVVWWITGFVALLVLCAVLVTALGMMCARETTDRAITTSRLNALEAAVDKMALREAFQHEAMTNAVVDGGAK